MNVLFEGSREELNKMVETINQNFDYLVQDRSRIITLDEILAGTPLAFDDRCSNWCIILER